MALQDDIFDVGEAVKDTPAEAAFERICSALNALELDADNYVRLSDALMSIQSVLNRSQRVVRHNDSVNLTSDISGLPAEYPDIR